MRDILHTGLFQITTYLDRRKTKSRFLRTQKVGKLVAGHLDPESPKFYGNWNVASVIEHLLVHLVFLVLNWISLGSIQNRLWDICRHQALPGFTQQSQWVGRQSSSFRLTYLLPLSISHWSQCLYAVHFCLQAILSYFDMCFYVAHKDK